MNIRLKSNLEMVDVGKKKVTEREAAVEGKVLLKPSTILAIKKKKVPKGDVLLTAKIAGIMAAKKTFLLLPLCHPIPIDYVGIEFSLEKSKIKIKTIVRTQAKTGPEMEAFVATSICCLTIYDMCKPIDKDIVILEIKLLKKMGGKSGLYLRNPK